MEFLFRPVDNARLILFRILFGLVMFFETAGAVVVGWVDDVYISPEFTFSFIGFEWLQPLPGKWMYAVFFLLSILALCVSFGYRYRLSILLLWVGWSYVYIIHKASYNNHHYLMWMLIGIFNFLPAHLDRSLDVRNGRVNRRKWCRNWQIQIFIALYLIVYTYAALAKLYPDWYRGIPMKIWFEYKTSRALVGPFYEWKYAPLLFAWGGILFDLLVIPALLWKPTRVAAFVVSLFFHLGNSITFEIGTFPYLMIASSILFFPDPYIRRKFFPDKDPEKLAEIVKVPPNYKLHQGILLLFIMLQVLLPLRHHLFRGNVFWTEEGHRLSWRMMLKSKSGTCQFRIKDTLGNEWRHDPSLHLSREQYFTMSTRPDMIWQYCQRLKRIHGDSIQIYAETYTRVNRGPLAPIVDSKVDMARVAWHPFNHENWITEFPGWSEAN